MQGIKCMCVGLLYMSCLVLVNHVCCACAALSVNMAPTLQLLRASVNAVTAVRQQLAF